MWPWGHRDRHRDMGIQLQTCRGGDRDSGPPRDGGMAHVPLQVTYMALGDTGDREGVAVVLVTAVMGRWPQGRE